MSQPDDDGEATRLSFFANPTNWPLFYHTATNMNARQLVGVAERKARHAVVPRLPIDFDRRYEQEVPNRLSVAPGPIAANSSLLADSLDDSERERYRTLVRQASEGSITFLNRSIDFGDEIDWHHGRLEEYPLLWRLKLQSFEFLEWAVLGFDDPTAIEDVHDLFQRWLLSWTTDNPIGERNYLRRSWIPHSVSLRILNWSRYAAWCERAALPVDDRLYRQIYKNASFLENHIEFEIGGNHLIENAIALVMAGVLFEEHETGWTETGLEVLDHASETQFLADGGHFERSPMYHLMVLMRYLTAVDLLSRAGIEVPLPVERVAEDGVTFLRAIQAPDGRIPLLNDAVYGEVRSASTCLRYATQIGFGLAEADEPSALEGSGYYWLGSGDTRMLIDGGPVGPAHLPAHSHNDQLSFNLWVEGEPIITDTGTFEYAPTERRQYSRSVRAHSTIQVEDEEPIDIGGQYLMGKRTAPTVTLHEGDDGVVFEGTVRKEPLLGDGYTHRRRVTMSDDEWRVHDSVTGGEFTSRLHFHPTVTVSAATDGAYHATTDGVAVSIQPASAADSSRTVSTEYYPEFGTRQQRTTVEFAMESDRTQFEYVIRPEATSQDERPLEHATPGER